MAQKKKISKKIYIAVIFGIVFGIGLLSLGADEKYFGELIPFTLVRNVSVDCKAWNQIDELGINGKVKPWSARTEFFDVFTNFELISGSPDVGEIRLIDTEVKIECTQLGNFVGTFEMVGGRTLTKFYATQENGQEIFIKSISKTISTIPRPVLDRATTIPTGNIVASEIDSKLTSTSESYHTRIRIIVEADIEFKASATGSFINTGKFSIIQGITVKVHNEIVDPPQPVSNTVKLISVTGGIEESGKIELGLTGNKGTIFVTVTGQLPQWKSSEGTPFVDVFDADRQLFIRNVHLTIKKLISSSTNTYEFTGKIDLGVNPKVGYWTFTLHSNQDIRKTTGGLPSVAVKLLQIIDTTQTTTTSCPSGQELVNGVCKDKVITCPIGKVLVGGICLEESQAPTQETKVLTDVEAFYSYKLTFADGEKSGTIPQVPTFGITFTELSFINLDDNRVFEVLNLKPEIDFSGIEGIAIPIASFEHRVLIDVGEDGSIAKIDRKML